MEVRRRAIRPLAVMPSNHLTCHRGHRTLDIVFAATDPVLGREHSREPGLEPRFVPPGQLMELDLHPSLAGRLNDILDPGLHGYAPYVWNFWRQAAVPEPSPET
jgi:hypothetical protein